MSKRTNDYETILNLSELTNNKLRKINDNRYDQIINKNLNLQELKAKALTIFNNKILYYGKFNERIRYWDKKKFLEYPDDFNDDLCSYVYCIRIYVRQGFQFKGKTEYFSYKIGKCDDDPRLRCGYINNRFESRYETDNKNLLFIFILKIRVAGTTLIKTEKKFHNLLSNYNIKEFTVNKLTRETFKICPESYELFENYLQKSHCKEDYWISDNYTIDNNIYSNKYGEESYDQEYIGSLMEYEEKTIKDIEHENDISEDDASHDEEDYDSDYEDKDSECDENDDDSDYEDKDSECDENDDDSDYEDKDSECEIGYI